MWSVTLLLKNLFYLVILGFFEKYRCLFCLPKWSPDFKKGYLKMLIFLIIPKPLLYIIKEKHIYFWTRSSCASHLSLKYMKYSYHPSSAHAQFCSDVQISKTNDIYVCVWCLCVCVCEYKLRVKSGSTTEWSACWRLKAGGRSLMCLKLSPPLNLTSWV